MTALPNFFIIGAARSGTNSLCRYLAQHPEVYLCPHKEPRFFAFEGERPAFSGHKPDDYSSLPTFTHLDAYAALFEPSTTAKAVGEASTVYLYYPGDKPAERIRFHLPDAKLIAILRQPADRAYSNFLLAVQSGWEPCTDFGAALAAEEERAQANWSYFLRYRQNSLYHQQLMRFYDRFPAAQIKILLYDDLVARPVEVVHDIFRFLEVDPTFTPDVSRRHVPSRGFRIAVLDHPGAVAGAISRVVARLPPALQRPLRTAVRRWNQGQPPSLDPALRRRLTDGFRPDVLALERLIGRDLSPWLA